MAKCMQLNSFCVNMFSFPKHVSSNFVWAENYYYKHKISLFKIFNLIVYLKFEFKTIPVSINLRTPKYFNMNYNDLKFHILIYSNENTHLSLPIRPRGEGKNKNQPQDWYICFFKAKKKCQQANLEAENIIRWN